MKDLGFALVTLLLLLIGCSSVKIVNAPIVYNQEPGEDLELDEIDPFTINEAELRHPEWAESVVWYQIFPERFRNGDTSNDPTWNTLEFPENVPQSWELTPWGEQWYRRAAWEEELGDNFYENGVFDRRLGGDLQGVIDKLDYLEDLGITGIYFNPLFYGRSLHKYDGNTFHHIDPHFGPDPGGDIELIAAESSDPTTWEWTSADKLFLDLLSAAHRRGIRVIIDGVFNHTGRGFFAFDDILNKQADSPYKDWYIIESFDDPMTEDNEFVYKGWWDVHTLPLLANTEDDFDLHPAPKKYVFDITRRWMDPDGNPETEDGIDGWRLDVAEDMPKKFWNDWNDLVHELNNEAYTTAEYWHNASDYLDEMGFSATMNYFGFAYPVKGFFVDEKLSGEEFGELLSQRRDSFGPLRARILQNLIDSHDTERVASMIVNREMDFEVDENKFAYDSHGTNSPRYTDKFQVRPPNGDDREIQKILALFQMTYVGAPMIYHGTETGMWGADDPDDRMGMFWPDMEYENMDIGPNGVSLDSSYVVAFDSSIHSFYRDLIQLRKNEMTLSRGDYSLVYDGGSDDAMAIAYSRTLDDDIFLILINREDAEHSFEISKADIIDDGESLWRLVFDTWDSDDGFDSKLENGLVTLPRYSARIYSSKK